MRTNWPASKPSGAPSTRSEKSASVQCRFSTTLAACHFSLIERSLDTIRLEAQVLHLGAQNDDRAVAPVVAGIGELEGVGAREAQLPLLVAREAQPREGDRIVE